MSLPPSTVLPSSDSWDEIKNYMQQADLGLQKKRLFGAIKLYSAAVAKLEKTKTLIYQPQYLRVYTSRSSTYCNVGLYGKALTDADKAMSVLINLKIMKAIQDITTDPHEESLQKLRVKAIVCKLHSQWGLRKYEEALAFIASEIPDFPENYVLNEMHKKAKTILEQSKGNYNLLELQKLSKTRRHFVGEYKGPVKSTNIAGKGRGLVATEDIAMGDVIMCDKAFWIIFEQDRVDFQAQITLQTKLEFEDVNCDKALVSAICQMMTYDADSRQKLNHLYRGPRKSPGEPPKSAVEEVFRLVLLNALRSTHDPDDQSLKGRTFSGLWTLAALLNHNCIEHNSNYSIFGDIFLLRAVKPIKKGEEVTITYWEPVPNLDRRCLMEYLDIPCNCRICNVEDNESPGVKSIVAILWTYVMAKLPPAEEEQVEWYSSLWKFTKVKQLLELRETKGFPNSSICILDPSMDRILEDLAKLKKYRQRIYLQEKIHDLTKNNCFVVRSVQMSVNILWDYYSFIEDVVSTLKWWKQVKNDSIAAYGTVEILDALKIVSTEEIEFFNSMEQDSLVMDVDALSKKYNVISDPGSEAGEEQEEQVDKTEGVEDEGTVSKMYYFDDDCSIENALSEWEMGRKRK